MVYEEAYVKELMTIEQEARKYVTDAIELEQALFELEQKTKLEDTLISKYQTKMNQLKKDLVK